MASIPTDGDYLEAMNSILVMEQFTGRNPNEPAKIMEGVYLGSQRNAENWKILEKLGITHVLNCAAYKGPRTYEGSPYEGLDIDYYEFPADDTDTYDITNHFPEAFHFIDKARRRGGNVLVHCAMGINRSGAVCLAYLVDRSRMPILKATRVIKSKRRALLNNPGFRRLLVRFARRRGLLDDPEKESSLRHSTHRNKNYRQRSRSCCNLAPADSRITWPDDGIKIINGGLDNLVISDAYPLNGDSIYRYSLVPEVIIPRHFGSSLSRFDLFCP